MSRIQRLSWLAWRGEVLRLGYEEFDGDCSLGDFMEDLGEAWWREQYERASTPREAIEKSLELE